MTSTGIVRKADKLGRIVIPMELRRTLFINETDPGEILLNTLMMQELTTITTENMPALIKLIDEGKNTMETSPIAIATLTYISDNSTFLKAMLGPNGNTVFQLRLKEFIWKSIFSNDANPFIKEDKLLVPGQYLASYIASAHIGVIQQWLLDGHQETPEEMANILSTMTVNGIVYAAGLKEQ